MMEALISTYGLSRQTSPPTTVEHEAIVQFDATDWDTLLTRAEMNGMIVIIDAGKVSVKPPETSGVAALQVTYGESLIELRAEIDAVSQYAASAVKSVAWDSATQALIESSGSASATVTEAGNVTSDTLAKVLGVEQLRAGDWRALSQQEDLTAWSSAELLRSKLAKICGQVRFQGSALAKTGTMIALAGARRPVQRERVHQRRPSQRRDGNWLTTVDFGLPAGWHAQQRPAAFAAAAGHLPPIRGLQTGVVKQIHEDPAGAFRILVTLPLVQGGTNSVWARLASLVRVECASGRRSTLRLATR